MKSSTSCTIVLLLACILQRETADAWGSNSLDNSYRPTTSWEGNFPSTPTITVSAGGDVTGAISQCNSVVGSSGYCTVQLNGNPSDSTIEMSRSRTKLTSPKDFTITSPGVETFIRVSGSGLRDVVVEDLHLVGYATSEVFGVIVRGANMANIIIRNLEIHDFDGSDNAHGIAVFGDGSTPVSNVLITGNEVYNMQTGSSESIVVNGNVEGWKITDNEVRDVSNIAIDAIGGEGVYSPGTSAQRPLANDAARHGFIEGNTVLRMSTKNNPQYDGESWAAAIYVDGGRDILIDGNTVDAAAWGIEVGAENCMITSDVVVTGNIVTNSFFGDFLTGGYNPGGYLADSSIECNPLKTADVEEGHGYVERITVEENNFASTSTSEDSILAQFRTTYAIIAEPGASAENENGNGSAPGDENAVRTS